MDSIHPSISSFTQSKNTTIKNLLKEGPSSQKNDRLTNSLVQRNQQTLQMTYLMLKERLGTDLETTIQDHIKEYPEMENNYYVALLSDQGSYTAEVVEQEKAINSVVDASQEEAEKAFAENPVGYFNASDFTLKTPNLEGYKKLQDKLQDYFKRNHEIISYLQSNPESNVTQEDLYQGTSSGLLQNPSIG